MRGRFAETPLLQVVALMAQITVHKLHLALKMLQAP
jgi:hypothetical protein